MRKGLSLVELTVVLLVVAVLGAVAVAPYERTTAESRATRVYADFDAVRSGAMMYFLEQDAWPADGPSGELPAALRPYVDGVAMSGPGYTMDWDRWEVDEGTIAGLSVTITDPGLEAAFVQRFVDRRRVLQVDNRYTLVIHAPEGYELPGAKGNQGIGQGVGGGQDLNSPK